MRGKRTSDGERTRAPEAPLRGWDFILNTRRKPTKSSKQWEDRIGIPFQRPSLAAARRMNQIRSSLRWEDQLGVVVPMRGQGCLNKPSGGGRGGRQG